MAKAHSKPIDQWIIKDENGRVIGPYRTDGILNLITKKVLRGEEFIAEYPNGSWLPIGSNQVFFDHILDTMEKNQGQTYVAGNQDTQIVSAEMVRKTIELAKEKEIVPLPAEPQKLVFVPVPQTKASKKAATKNPPFSLKPSKNNRIAIIVLSAGGLLLLFGALLLWLGDVHQQGEKIHLISPHFGSKVVISAGSYQEMSMRAQKLIEMDNFSNWAEAQNLLVSLAESNPKSGEIRELLCFTYIQLWPFAYQDREDSKTLKYMAQSTKSLNPAARFGKSCELVRAFLEGGNYNEVRSQLETLLRENPTVVFFLWLKAEMSLAELDYLTAEGYASSVLNIWPNFIHAKVLLAEAGIGAGKKFQSAASLLQDVLKLNPQHKVAKILLGQIEIENFRQEDDAWTHLISAEQSSEKVSRYYESMNYYWLAFLSQKKGQKKEAQNYIKIAASLNHNEPRIKQLLYSLGETESNIRSDSRIEELIGEGDKYSRMGDCLSAQAHYKAAFDLAPKNPIPAVKAARCLWQLYQTLEAIEYLQRALKADPQHFQAYVLLADYYSQRYDYDQALSVLGKARNLKFDSYEVMKGYALVTWRKGSFSESIGYAKNAARLFDSDAETSMILARDYAGQGKLDLALAEASKAVELDPSSSEIQIEYVSIFSKSNGTQSAIVYLENLIEQNQFIVEYKLKMGDMLLSEDRYREAQVLYEQSKNFDNRNKKAYLGLGRALQGQGKMEESLSQFLLSDQKDPSDPTALYYLGSLYYETNRYPLAKAQFDRVIERNSNFPGVHYALGRTYLAQGNLKGAVEEASIERRKNPNSLEPYILIGDAYMNAQQYSAAAMEYREVVARQPALAGVLVKLAKCHRLSGNLDAAVDTLNRAEKRESGLPEIYKERGALYQQQGEALAALKAYEKYLALSPSAPDRLEVEDIMNKLSGSGQ